MHAMPIQQQKPNAMGFAALFDQLDDIGIKARCWFHLSEGMD